MSVIKHKYAHHDQLMDSVHRLVLIQVFPCSETRWFLVHREVGFLFSLFTERLLVQRRVGEGGARGHGAVKGERGESPPPHISSRGERIPPL